ncbi:Gonadotropin-releasing hormone receptor [Folsomia candida]|uniref:Gonadotropin-releasing hormone receptor n=2 Tax=Folsomia candida TaxID=158441 RepID=A0A226EQM5_FOLCA|nr:Gonadotropin-releasing hormone receptor [Folsomia candida]
MDDASAETFLSQEVGSMDFRQEDDSLQAAVGTGSWWLSATMSSLLMEEDPSDNLASDTYFSTSNFTNSSSNNFTEFSEMPKEMREMSQSARTSVLIYSIIWIIASTGNLTVFASCYRQYKKHKSRITLLILHLSVADLIVTFCLIPIEIAWRMTIQWYGGNILCKLCQFMRAFGLYLSSMVLICVSFDRFFSILFPLKFAGGKHRVKVMLGLAWVASVIFSLPQAIFFSVETHPKFITFRQCVTSSFLSSPEDVRMYSIFSVSAMYFVPLLVIIFTYTAILLKIIRKSRQQQSNNALSHPISTSATPPINNSNPASNALRRVNSASASHSMSASTSLPINPNLRVNPNGGNASRDSIGTFTPSPSSKVATALRFNFSQSSIERTQNRSASVRWSRGTFLKVPGEDDCQNTGCACVADNSTSNPNNQCHCQLKGQNDIDESLDDSSTSISMNPLTPISVPMASTNNEQLSRTMSMRSNGKTQLILRMSSNATSNITRAKSRTLRLTIVILLVFILCWTPYVVMTLWYCFDWATAQRVDQRIQDALFMMAVANSSVNPLVYGSFRKNCCGLTKRMKRNKSRKDVRPSTIKEALESQASNN